MKIAISGKQCAGKSTFADIVSERNGAKLCKVIDKIYQVNDLLDVPRNRGFMQDLGEIIRQYFGKDYFVKDLAKRVTTKSSKNIVTDDMRKLIEFDTLKSAGFLTVYIKADAAIRRKRAENLGLDFRENHPAEQEIEQLENRCDFVIKNNGTLEELEDKITYVFEKSGSENFE